MTLETIRNASFLLILLSITGLGAWLTFRDSRLHWWARGTWNRWKARRRLNAEAREPIETRRKGIAKSITRLKDW